VAIDSLASNLRTLVGVEQVSQFKDGDDQLNVILRLDEPFRNNPATMGDLLVPAAQGAVRVSDVARLSREPGTASIDRLMCDVHKVSSLTSEQRRDDARELSALGYAQELFRTVGGFSNFALSFSIISILTGAVTLYSHGLAMGGPAEMAFGWPLVSLFTLAVALSMAELASSIPTSGAMYHWACRLGGKGWGWFTAWFNIIGQLSALAGIDSGCALFVTPLAGLPMTTGSVLIVYAGVLFSHALINHVGIRLVARLNDLSVTVHVVGVIAIVSAVFLFAPKQPIGFFFARITSNTEG